MADDPRRFDGIERTVRGLRQQVHDLQGTALARIATHTHSAADLEIANLGNDGHECRYHQSGTAQSISDSIDSQVYLDSSDYTTADVTQILGSITVGSSFVINRAGLWLLQANARFDPGGTTNTLRQLLIAEAEVIATRYAQAGGSYLSTGPDHILSCSTSVRLGSGATVAMWVRQESGTARVLDNALNGVNFSMTWLRA